MYYHLTGISYPFDALSMSFAKFYNILVHTHALLLSDDVARIYITIRLVFSSVWCSFSVLCQISQYFGAYACVFLLWDYVSIIRGWLNNTKQAKMITLFHTIFVIFAEFSTPISQNEVRQITYQFVEAMREAERKKTIKSSRSFIIVHSIDRIDFVLVSYLQDFALIHQLLCGKRYLLPVCWP